VPTADRGTARLAYSVEGSGPDVLLLHAGVTDSRSWGPLRERLGGTCRTIAYDRRGYGDTVAAPEPHDPVDDALAVLDAARVERATLIGASRGGRLAIDLALRHPRRVAGLVLIGAGVAGAPQLDIGVFADPVRALEEAYADAEEGGDPDVLNRVEAHAWLDGWSSRENRVRGFTRDLFLAMNGLHLQLAQQAGPEIAGVPDAWDRVATISVPTLVLVGALDDTEIAASQHLGATIPGACLEILDGTGHLPHLEGHRRCLELIAGFLTE
jgi:pimeloyl-ACP methyl ester carboxylesterase